MRPRQCGPANAAPRSDRRRDGFALVTVIWGVSLVAILIIPFMSGARLRLQSAYNMAGAAKAEFIAKAAIDNEALSLLEAQSEGPRSAQSVQGQSIAARAAGMGRAQKAAHAGQPRLCAIDGAAVAIAVEDEAGKVDLNGASQELLAAMLKGFGFANKQADLLARAIVEFRSTQPAPGRAASDGLPAAKHALFETVFELDQVAGVEGPLFRELLPYVTVHSRHPGVDPESAPPALFAALAGLPAEQIHELEQAPYPNALDRADPKFPSAFKQSGDGGALLVHAEARLPSGQLSVLEAVLDLHGASLGGAGAGQPFAVRELRRSVAPRYAEALRAALLGAGAPPDC